MLPLKDIRVNVLPKGLGISRYYVFEESDEIYKSITLLGYIYKCFCSVD